MFETFQNNITEGIRSKWILILLAVIFLILVLFVVSNKRIRSLPLINKFTEKRDTDKLAKTYWTNTLANPILRVKGSEIPHGFQPDMYTVLIDILWLNTRTTNQGNIYRHILHKGSNELQVAMDSGSTQMCPSSGGGGMTSTGLPTRMNPGIFADPYLNDLLIFMDTEYENKHIRESVRIPDIPMDMPFRIALIVQKRSLEVYINCKLEVTKVLNGMPISVDSDWFGRAGKAPFVGQIQNLKLWPTALTVGQISSQCPAPIVFINKQIPCNPMDTPTQPTDINAPPAIPNPLLTYGNALSVCRST